jgi:integrase
MNPGHDLCLKDYSAKVRVRRPFAVGNQLFGGGKRGENLQTDGTGRRPARSQRQELPGHCTSEPRLSSFQHHDFRHFFATTYIESGVDIPTVSRWLGHKDGGALAMRVYGHLRQEHSFAAVKSVAF